MAKETGLARQSKTIAEFFQSRKDQIAAVLPNVGITADRMLQVLFNSMRATPALMKCDPASLFKALIQTASVGLEPNTPLGHAYLIPFGKEVQVIIGYKGYLALCRRAGEVSSISSQIVYSNDQFEYELGTDERIKHVPAIDDRGDPVYAYAVAHFKTGGYAFEVMSIKQVDAIRKRSKAAKSGPWVTDWEQMVRKTLIRRLCNYLPLSIDLARATAIDTSNEAGRQDLSDLSGAIDAEFTEAPPEKKEPPKSKLAGMADEKKEEPVSNPNPTPTVVESGKIACPNMEGCIIPISECDDCKNREGCPAH